MCQTYEMYTSYLPTINQVYLPVIVQLFSNNNYPAIYLASPRVGRLNDQPLVQRCLFFASSFGCKKGDACAFCHHYVSATQAGIPAQRPKNTRRRKFQDDVQQLLLQLNVEQQGPMNVATWIDMCFLHLVPQKKGIEFGKISVLFHATQVMQLQIMAQRNRYLRVLCQTGVDDLLWELDQTQPERPAVTGPAQNDSCRTSKCGALHCFSL